MQARENLKMCSSVLALSLGLVEREMVLGCVFGPAFVRGHVYVFAPDVCQKFGWNLPGILLVFRLNLCLHLVCSHQAAKT